MRAKFSGWEADNSRAQKSHCIPSRGRAGTISVPAQSPGCVTWAVTLKWRAPGDAYVVKQSRVLEEVAQGADVRYEETRLARGAVRARPRLAILLVLGVAGFALEAALSRSLWWGLGAAGLLLIALGVHRNRLDATVAATLAAAMALLIPSVYALVLKPAQPLVVLLAFVAVWGLAMLPDAVLLLRNHELQHAFGLWARRE